VLLTNKPLSNIVKATITWETRGVCPYPTQNGPPQGAILSNRNSLQAVSFLPIPSGIGSPEGRIMEGKHPGGRPSKDRVKRSFTIDRETAEYIDSLPEGQRSDFANTALRAEIRRQQTCSMCDNPAEVECKTGKCEPSKWYCGLHYVETHIPE
jgi:hypothetical protein